jgi:predicted regulator of Ras-like GTPase activity (Roadblock/LC7/MglB family)
MPFKQILKELVETIPGARGAILADWEGEAVEQHCLDDDFELKVVGAHQGIILGRLREIHDGLALGEPGVAVISTAASRVAVSPVGSDYTLVVTLGREAVVGVALQRMRGIQQRLVREIY